MVCPRLSDEQEECIKDEIERQGSQCSALRSHEVLNLANSMLEAREKQTPKPPPSDPFLQNFIIAAPKTPITKGYLKSFIKRSETSDQPIKASAPRYVDQQRASVTKEELSIFFDLVGYQFHQQKYHPRLIANLDETFFEVKPDKSRVLVPGRFKEAFTIDQQALFHMTIVVTIFADGSWIKPSLIFPMKTLPAELETSLLINSFNFSGQASGWIDKEIFGQIVRKHLIPQFEESRRALGPSYEQQWGVLFVDGHTSREFPEVLEELASHKIDVISFVSHSSHILQPLDRLVFLCLKHELQHSRTKKKTPTTTPNDSRA